MEKGSQPRIGLRAGRDGSTAIDIEHQHSLVPESRIDGLEIPECAYEESAADQQEQRQCHLYRNESRAEEAARYRDSALSVLECEARSGGGDAQGGGQSEQ